MGWTELAAANWADFIADDAPIRVVACGRPEDEFCQLFLYPEVDALAARIDAPFAVHDVGPDGGLFVSSGANTIPYFVFLQPDGAVGDLLVTADGDAVVERLRQIRADGWGSEAVLDAAALRAAGRYVEALAVAQTELFEAPADPRRWEMLCRVLFDKGDRDDAYARLEGALESFPEDPGLWALEAAERVADHASAEGEAAWRRVAALAPTDPWAALGVARCLLQRNEDAAARVEVQRALSLDQALAAEVRADPELGPLLDSD